MSSRRFQIEEMVSQDSTGAVFLAMDTQSGSEVLLQRFFPFGAEEGGLEGDELIAYGQAVERMKELNHPSLRRVIEGGCDPVDGMPFLVTEIRSSPSLREACASATLNVAQGRLLAESALALMLDLEKIFGQVAEWLVLQPEDVEVIGDVEQFRFGVDPMKWLGLRPGVGGVKELAALVEATMGWSGRVMTGSTAGLLSGWMRAAKSRELSPAQAMDVLNGGAVPQKTIAPSVALSTALATPSAPSTPVSLASAKSGGSTVWFVFGGIVVVAGLAIGIVMFLNNQQGTPPSPVVTKVAPASNPTEKVTPAVTTNTPAAPVVREEEKTRSLSEEDQMRAEIERKALALQQQAAAASPIPPKKPTPTVPAQPKKSEYAPGEVELLRQQMGEEVVIVAPVKEVKLSSTSKTLYIMLDGPAPEKIIGRYLTNLGVEGMSVSELGGLEGKRVRVSGKVANELGTNRLILDIKTREQIIEEAAP